MPSSSGAVPAPSAVYNGRDDGWSGSSDARAIPGVGGGARRCRAGRRRADVCFAHGQSGGCLWASLPGATPTSFLRLPRLRKPESALVEAVRARRPPGAASEFDLRRTHMRIALGAWVCAALTLLARAASPAHAQMHMQQPMSTAGTPLGIPETRQGSGTASLPPSWHMHAAHGTVAAL